MRGLPHANVGRFGAGAGTWNSRAIIDRVVNWANQLSRGKRDRRKGSAKARPVLGGTIGPVPVSGRGHGLEKPETAWGERSKP